MTRLRFIAAGLLTLAAPAISLAQERFQVTALSSARAAIYETLDSKIEASRGSEIPEGAVRVAAGEQLMAVSGGGVVCLLVGPASAVFMPDEQMIVMGEGKMMLAVAEEGIELGVRTPEEGGARAFQAALVPGRLYIARSGERVDVAYEGAGQLAVLAYDEETLLSGGQGLSLSGGQKQDLPAGWAMAEMPDKLGQDLSVAAARAKRVDVGKRLFENIIKWDQRAGAEYVVSRVEAEGFTPEIRQVTTIVSQPPPSTTVGNAAPPTVIRVAANEVPPLSPAALTVVDVANGVTAVTLNAQARDLLRTTGSIGLGFGGLGQLAIPGFFGGIRTIGPAGLGALR